MNLGISNNGSSSVNNMFPKMISITIVIIGLMAFMAMINFDFIPTKQIIEVDEKTVTVEGFDIMKKSDTDVSMSKGFCESHKGERARLQESCSKLTKKNCLATSCCVYAKMQGEEKCHSGDEHGPTFRRDEIGKTHDVDYYYFKNNCYGKECPTDK